MTLAAREIAASHVWDLVVGLPSPKRERRLIMVLQAYIDDSGGVEVNKHKMFVLADFISDAESWAAFSSEWQAALDQNPRLEYFKMSEASYLTKQFAMWRGWTKALRDERLEQLLSIICKYHMLRVSVSINKEAFYKYVATIKIRKPSPTAGNPYYLAFHHLVLGLPLIQAFNARASDHTKIDFIFDTQQKTGTRASEAWEDLKAKVIPKVVMQGVPDVMPYLGSPPIFRSEKEFLPLQAADLYAWHVRKHHDRNRLLIVGANPTLTRIGCHPGHDKVIEVSEMIGLRDDLLKTLAVGFRWINR